MRVHYTHYAMPRHTGHDGLRSLMVELNDWLMGITERQRFIPYVGDRGQSVVSGLDFIHAIEWHMKWRTDIEDYLAGRNSVILSPEEVSRDDRCVLGMWLKDGGEKAYGTRRGFRDLVKDHALFHLSTGDLLKCFNEHRDCPDDLRQNFLTGSELVLKHLARLYLQLVSDRGTGVGNELSFTPGRHQNIG